MSLLASPIHSFVHLFILFLFTLVVFIYTFVHLYIRFMFTLFVFFSLHLSIFTSFYVYTCCLFLYAFVHLYIRFMCTFFVFFSPSICTSYAHTCLSLSIHLLSIWKNEVTLCWWKVLPISQQNKDYSKYVFGTKKCFGQI